MKKTSILCSMFVFLFLFGCGGKTTITRQDPVTGDIVITEKESSFWKSENQEMAFDAVRDKIAAGVAIANKKLEQIEKNAVRRMNANLPSEALAYADALDSVIISNIRHDIPVNDIPMPKNAADVMERNIIPLTYAGISLAGAAFDWDIGGPFGGTNKGDGSSYLRDVSVGGDLYLNSEMNGQYSLTDEASWSLNPTTDMSTTTTTTTSTYTGNNEVGGDGSPTSSTPSSDDSGLF